MTRCRQVLVLRPDTLLSVPLQLAPTCANRNAASFNVISSSFVRDMFFHKRDWDYAYLACDSRSINLWMWPFFHEELWCTPEVGLPTHHLPALTLHTPRGTPMHRLHRLHAMHRPFRKHTVRRTLSATSAYATSMTRLACMVRMDTAHIHI